MAVTSSGKEVPSATKVRAMTLSGTPSAWAISVPSEKEAILLTRVAAQIFGAYLPDKTLLDLTGVPKKQVTLESCHNPEIHIGHPDAVR